MRKGGHVTGPAILQLRVQVRDSGNPSTLHENASSLYVRLFTTVTPLASGAVSCRTVASDAR